jgi:hypothetical protein
MKALAAEIVRKFTKRLQWLAIRVRELTGDMQMTKSEIAETQVIVTTPEKWDVVTRKPTGEGDIASVCLSPLRKYMILKNIDAAAKTVDYRRGSPFERRTRCSYRSYCCANIASGTPH